MRLRVFTNINPTKSRVRVTTDPFDVLAPQLAMSAGLSDVARQACSPFRTWQRRFVRLARAVGIPLRDRSPYDRFMLRFHDHLKTNQAFQDGCAKYRWEFPPNATWPALTDMVPHAALSGQHALEQTLIVSQDVLLLPQKAPVHVLERLAETSLTN